MKVQLVRFFSLLVSVNLISSCGGGGSGASSVSSARSSSVTSSSSLSSSSLSSSSSSTSSQSSASSSVDVITQCEVVNFENDETIFYRFPILKGRCPLSETILDIEVAERTYSLPVVAGHFKGAVLLDEGINEIRLVAGEEVISSSLRYEPSDNPKKVKMVYATAANDDGQFLAAPGEANDLETAKDILRVKSLMMQSATAEMMYKATGEHQTYALVEDESGMPLIEVFAMQQSKNLLHAMDGLEIYYSLQNQLKTEEQNDNKYMVVMGFSGYENGNTLAHTALGGGNLALFGGLHLHTCPTSVEEIPTSFSNATLIDTNILPDDSAGRGTYWANCATGMGASLHEIGHTFGLPHTDYGIMARGFDRFNRLFMMSEPGYEGHLTTIAEHDAVWHPGSVNILLASPWIQ